MRAHRHDADQGAVETIGERFGLGLMDSELLDRIGPRRRERPAVARDVAEHFSEVDIFDDVPAKCPI